ncbi:MAG: hypothetical protein U0176_24345 [Bacteroidia bacterium]
MQHFRNFVCLLLLLVGAVHLNAQNGNAVIASVKVYDLGNGTGVLAVHVSGNQASNYVGGRFAVSSDRIPSNSFSGGLGVDTRYNVPNPAPGQGNGNSNGNQTVVLTAAFPLLPGSSNHSDFANVELRVRPSTETFPELNGNRSVPFYTVTVE